MSKLRLSLFFLVITSLLILSFKFIEADKKAAVVQQYEGVSVFIQCTPRDNYEFVSTLKKSFAWSGSDDEMIKGLAKKARKEFPSCDGIIFHDFDFEKCDVIKFK